LPQGSRASPRFSREDDILIRRLVSVAFFLEVGLLLIVLPWSEFWELNYFVVGWPALQSLVTNDFVRGGISGLGIVNVVVGITELSRVFASRPRSGLSLDVEPGPHSDPT
jgi:hypothetical protein